MPTDITVTRQDIRYTTTLETLSCGTCGIPFAMPEDMHDKARKTGESFWCPNGHNISYHQSENAKLQRQLADAQRQRDNARAAYDRERDRAASAERSASAYKGQVTRIRKRVGNGVCPCCNRTFANVGRHMATQHPDYAQSET